MPYVQTADLFTPITRRGDSIVPPASHRDDPHTSGNAADSMGRAAALHRTAIMTGLILYGPQTGHELAERLRWDYVKVAKRLTELNALGQIRRKATSTHEGKPVYHSRLSPSGRPACVWYLAT